MNSEFPKDAAEFADMAHLMAERILSSAEASDCFAAILAAVHLPEWHYGESGWDTEKKTFSTRYSDWDLLRQLANGAKHARLNEGESHPKDLVARPIEWEDQDAWDSLGSANAAWFVEHEGQLRTVIALCRGFIARFRLDEGF